MPLYDYHCSSCGADFEIRLSFAEKEAGLIVECPICHADQTNQVLSGRYFLQSRDGGNPPASSSCGGFQSGGCCG